MGASREPQPPDLPRPDYRCGGRGDRVSYYDDVLAAGMPGPGEIALGEGTTLRLNMPQWQGGNLAAYHFGAELLSDVAAAADVVGLAITAHLPWDTLAMRDM